MENKNKKLLYGISLSFVAVLLTVLVIVCVYQYDEKVKYKNLLEASYESKLYSVAEYMGGASVTLDKLLLATGNTQSIPLYAELCRQSSAALEGMAGLPYNQSLLQNSMKYLTQLGDFSKVMLNKAVYNEDISEEDEKNLFSLTESSKEFKNQINLLISQTAMSQTLDWSKLSAEESRQENGTVKPSSLLGSILPVSQALQSYSSLIYDGPFSSHISKAEPEMTKGKSMITPEEALEICKSFLGENASEFTLVSESESEGVIPVYSFEAKYENGRMPDVFIDITKHGGYPLWMLRAHNTAQSDEYIPLEKALENAGSFLADNGMFNMKHSYYESSDTSVVFNFACFTNGVAMYPDLVKVKVSLTSGEIIGYDARGYLTNHIERRLPDTIMSPEEAVLYINSSAEINSVQKAVIPLPDLKEAFCYEFNVSQNNEDYLVFINAVTGKTESILKLMVNEYGVLTE